MRAPRNTIPDKEWRALEVEADRHGCDSVGELVTAPTRQDPHHEMPPSRAGEN